MKERIESKLAPEAIGPYSQAIKADHFVFVSGQLPIDKNTGTMPEGIREQTHQSIKNIEYILKEVGSSLDDVLKTTVYLNDINDFSAMNEVYEEYFKGVCPARAAFEVSALPKKALVEIEAISYVK